MMKNQNSNEQDKPVPKNQSQQADKLQKVKQAENPAGHSQDADRHNHVRHNTDK